MSSLKVKSKLKMPFRLNMPDKKLPCRTVRFILIFRLIKLVKDTIKSVRSESLLQRTLLAIDVMREARGTHKASNSTNAKLQCAIRAILNLNS